MEFIVRILHLEDDPFDSEVVRDLLSGEDLDAVMHRVDTLSDFQHSLDRGCYDLILCDYTIPGVNTFEALQFARERCPQVPFIFLSGTMGEDTAIESLKKGASDYILKHRMARLGAAVRRALQDAREQALRRQAEQALHESQEALRRSEAWLRLAVEAADLGTWDWYPPTGQLVWSPRCKAMFGLAPDAEPTYQLFVSRLYPEDRQQVMRTMEETKDPRGKGKFALEFRALQTDGSYAWIRAHGRAIFAADGTNRRVVRVAGTTQDITPRKQAQLELARTNEALEQKVHERTAQLRESVTELEQFSYTITHDMRAPLRAMQGFGELLLAECQSYLPPAHQTHLQLIVQAADRMDKLITDALDYTKVMRQELSITLTNAGALLRGIIESYPQLQPPHAHISILGDIPEVMGNAAGLTQVFANLLNNAVKFVRPGTTPEVRIWAEERATGLVRLWFEDNGIGIPPDCRERIWGMFQRLNPGQEGTGIGLALVRKVMDRLGGRVGVESEPGQGSRFWIELKKGVERGT